ncbi:uncharacterized protein LOC127759936 [Oryza glaberrima]|uniref:uncharacterized protein LOC127759936 n=1 Tax=Oryza glaberrima TaxID=4538 RepID=UPI00224C1835|nr:uncharacterized protein LOC127759936 [Oryza glaberrima]XP_052140110.1 uncharacterized protein LOC127759936 [Oryza glaberrima]
MDTNNGKGVVASWTSSMSSLMLSNLANLVASGTRTSAGFKQVHLNACARVVNEKFSTTLTGDQIRNHLKTWHKKFQKISRLRKVSGAIWDEENFIISLDEEHYNDYMQHNNKSDAEFFNRPITNYGEMLTIFGSTMATGNFAKDSSSALGTEDVEGTENEVNEDAPTVDHDERSSASKPKRQKTYAHDDDGLVGAFDKASDKLANAIIRSSTVGNELPDDLWDNLNSLPRFEQHHISFYYHYLVSNPHIARAFNGLPFANKLDWVAMYISEKFPGAM